MGNELVSFGHKIGQKLSFWAIKLSILPEKLSILKKQLPIVSTKSASLAKKNQYNHLFSLRNWQFSLETSLLFLINQYYKVPQQQWKCHAKVSFTIYMNQLFWVNNLETNSIKTRWGQFRSYRRPGLLAKVSAMGIVHSGPKNWYVQKNFY